MAQEAGRSSDEHWKLVTMNQASGMGERPHATVVLKQNGAEKRAEAQGDRRVGVPQRLDGIEGGRP